MSPRKELSSKRTREQTPSNETFTSNSEFDKLTFSRMSAWAEAAQPPSAMKAETLKHAARLSAHNS